MTSVSTNLQGIPEAPFIENVEEYLKQESAEAALQKLQETISKYKFMETHLTKKQAALKQKLPEMEKNIETIDHLKNLKNSSPVMFELSDTLFANALIEPSNTVKLWLGANVMCEYPIDEAHALLQSKLKTIEENLDRISKDLEFLKSQITTMEVNMARVYNFEIKMKRQQ